MKNLITQSEQVLPRVIFNGQKIICMMYGRTKFIDSLLYFNMKLSDLVKAFGLDRDSTFARNNLRKGYFPHLFNSLENAEYEGRLPEPRYYGVDSMSTRERENFFEWYNENSATYVFKMKQEIVEYCRLDVEILRRACLAFRKIILDLGNSEPFENSCTMASLASFVFREKHLKANTIGLIPPGGYTRADKHSQKAVEWLLICEREAGRPIRQAANGREFFLPEGLKIDGYLEAEQPNEKGIVYEFQGCYVHGCVKCFKHNRDRKIVYGNKSFNEALENTRSKVERMRTLGYTVVEMWECEFDRMKKENREISNYIKNHPLRSKETIDPRLAFYGGRCENPKNFYQITPSQEIHHLDICSLYPWACKRGNFPVGHPKILVGSQIDEYTNGDNNDLSRVNGLIKLKWLAPRNLYVLLLPVKLHNHLLFALCRTCCEEMRQSDCIHEDISEREFEGVYVIDEIRKAISLGYRVTKIDVIWHYEMTRYDQNTREGGLFASYIDTFLKIKQEASGWPSWCTDDESKKRYVEEYEREEGIKLEPSRIEHNTGMRSVAKFFLVSAWGKFGQKSNMNRTEIIKTRESLLKLLTAPEKEVHNALSVEDDILYVNWTYRDEAADLAPNTNVVIACFVTAIARLKLYEILEKLQRRVLYYDTDSCIYVNNTNAPYEYKPELSNLLGGWVDELASDYAPGSIIRQFAAPAPKFHSYEVVKPNGEVIEKCKVKGITLNYDSQKKINFKSVKDLVFQAFQKKKDDLNVPSEIRVNFRAIRRVPFHDVVTRDESKICRAVLKKRRYVTPETSLPFGYKNERL